MPAAIKKICQHCKEEKPLSEFFHNVAKNDTHNGICKECQLKINKKNSR